MTDIIRVMRLMIYTGPRDMVENTFAKGAVPANGYKDIGDMTITSVLVDQFPEIIKQAEDKPKAPADGYLVYLHIMFFNGGEDERVRYVKEIREDDTYVLTDDYMEAIVYPSWYVATQAKKWIDNKLAYQEGIDTRSEVCKRIKGKLVGIKSGEKE
ncbi:hypothetical protein PaMx41_ORF34 [Pseudomonas phage PaMx41]|uniref:Uncharacterized protein n=1 Tax=Pseudomonas phage PaMx41 TaxID=1815976 RepID=A0A1C8HQ14_BPPP4|nr:hypothetical protein KNT55_gp35 [Pseudomonas phage PaMx41]ANA48997.1 hypothetical protein PaMx41_ORF34 [Pseudomonas phage PaMx41]